MSFEDQITNATRSIMDFVGRDVTVVNPSNPIRDPDHNDVHFQDETRTETVAEVIERGSTEFEKRADSIAEDTDAMVLVKEGVTVTSGSDDQTTAATKIEDGESTYIVRGTFNQHNGLIRCHCRRES